MINYLQNTMFLGNSLMNYVYFLGALILSIIVAKIISFILKKYVQKFCDKTKTKIDDILYKSFKKPLVYTIFFIGLFFAINFLFLPESVDKIIGKIITVITVILITWGITRLVHSFMEIYWLPKAGKTKSHIDNNLIPVIKSIASWVIWVIAFIFVLNNLGFNVTSLVAGLGIGGLAIAFALQNVFADLFASISIYLDRPFNIGDYILTGNDSGTVKKIGLKTTRIQTLQGDELVISNKELTETRLRNYKKMKKRRVSFTFGVEYGTNPSKLEKIPNIVKKIVDKAKNVEFARAHFTDFGDSALNFEVVMFIANREFDLYRDVQQTVNLEITKAFKKERISMAFPTTTVHVVK